MNLATVFNFFLIAGAVQGFVFNIATLLSRRKIEKPVLFLNMFVLFLSLNNLQTWFIEEGFVPAGFFLSHFTIPWYVLIVPMFYAFLVYFLGIEKTKYPFLAVTALIFIGEIASRTLVLTLVGNGIWPVESVALYNAVEDAVTLAYSLFLYTKAIRILYKYEGLYQDILEYDNLNWIKVFLKLGGVVILLWFAAVILNLFADTFQLPYSYYPLRLGSSILIYWVGYQAFFRYVLLKDRIVLRAEIRKDNTQKAQPPKSLSVRPTDGIKEEAIFRNIHQAIQRDQKYLNPQLSMEWMADELSMSTGNLSRLVNRFSEHNFSDYINSFRVEESKKLLKNAEFSDYTIAAIGLECGFNSKSTFYAAFKKFTGQTPTNYRK